MSAYRNYAAWNKSNSNSTYSGSTALKSESTSLKYEPAYATHLPEVRRSNEGTNNSRLAQKYGTSTTSYQSAAGGSKEMGKSSGSSSISTRYKEAIEQKDNIHSHPPVSYRPVASRIGTRSRDPSAERDSVDRSSSSLGTSSISRPSLYSRSVSREHLDCSSTGLASTIPKYAGRISASKDSKTVLGQPSKKEEQAISSKFKTDRLDVESGSKKYITSRFLPKNTIEKSHTAYLKPTSTRIASSQREASRKSKEILNLLSTQNDNSKFSRTPSRCSSSLSEEKSNSDKYGNLLDVETVSVDTRSVSPNTQSKTSSLSDKVSAVPKIVIERQINKPQNEKSQHKETLAEKSKSKNMTATPWNSYLDLKFSSPGNSKSGKNGVNTCHHGKSQNSGAESPKSVSRNNSVKSISQSSSKSELKTKSMSIPTSTSSKQLPPPVPNTIKANIPIPNKDFRKSVLNMNTGKNGQKCHRSNSVSSADSEGETQLSEATDISENLSSCRSFHKTSSSSVSKLPVKEASECELSRRSNTPSECNSNSTAATSGSEDDSRAKLCSKTQTESSKYKGLPRVTLTTSMDDSSKPPMSPRVKIENSKSESDAKSFLIRTLGPVTGVFKFKHHESNEKVNWMDCSSDNVSDTSKAKERFTSSSNSELCSNRNLSQLENQNQTQRKFIKRVESGEKPWWQDENAEVPEGIQVYPEPQDTRSNKINFRRVESGEKPWWLDENPEAPEGLQVAEAIPMPHADENIMSSEYLEKHQIRHIDSGERGWWLDSTESIPGEVTKVKRAQSTTNKKWWIGSKKTSEDASGSDSEIEHCSPLGDRASPEGLEMPKESEIGSSSTYHNLQNIAKPKRPDTLFISTHKNIDDILGGASQSLSPLMDRIFGCQASKQLNKSSGENFKNSWGNVSESMSKLSIGENLDDASLQLYKDGDYASYLDLEASISEQQEEFEGFQSNKKNSIVLRTQLSVRVHTIIEKLLTSEGRELRRALFSLKQIFQEDKDLVHEFVQNDGLACLIKVGSVADQNYQNYILRALGQVMLYVDGMNGVIQHNETIQWLYSLISSKFRLVVKTALKLLLVFVEYVDTNCLLLIKAIQVVDGSQTLSAWYNIMKLLKDFDSADTELLIYAMTLINKCFNGIPDQDTYYDQTDALEEQGIEETIQRYMSKPGTDLDLLQQFQIYEAVLQYEDGEDKTLPLRHLEESVRKTLRSRKSLVVSAERRKSRRHSTGTSPLHSSVGMRKAVDLYSNAEDEESSSSQSSAGPNDVHLNGSYKENTKGNYTNSLQQRISNGNLLNRTPSRKDLTPLLNAVNKLDSDDGNLTKQPWILSMMYNGKNIDDHDLENIEDTNDNERRVLLHLKRENTVKDLTQKLANQNVLQSPVEDNNKVNRIGDMSGLISKAKEGLAKSKSKVDVLKSPTSETIPKTEAKKSENELRWEELVKSLNRPLNLCDLDFTDLCSDDETDILAPATTNDGIPPPPPPPLLGDMSAPPPPPISTKVPPVPNTSIFGPTISRITKPVESKIPIKKTKKTVKLFWKEVRDDPNTVKKIKSGLIWDELVPVSVDTQKLEHLFESRAKDLITKKQQELNKNKEIIVLDPKRSNAINIAMTKLPPPRSIKTAILKMDATIMNREGIEKLMTMLPTEEERTKIQEAQAANPDLPLGSAEQFLLTLASISELPARLNLWAFKLDFENLEREIAEPLMDLKQGFEVLKLNKTFRAILGTLLSIGIFLNGTEVKGFQIDYLSKVPEVKDTVHKHSLLHHLCHIVMEKFPDATDLYSEIGAITRASKIDFDELALNIQRLETDCKASWDHLKLIAKHDGSTMMKVKMSDFLADCAERIILLGIIHRRVMNRFHRFLLWLGIPFHQIADTKPNEFCRIISEFALEYRTTRERVLQQLEKKANHRERNKTRGKMITEIGKFRSNEDRADAELRQLLGSDMSDVESMQGTLPWRRRSRDTNRSFLCQANGNLTDGDDEILESLVKTATKGPSRTAPRERKRTRHADRKSLKRSRTRENNPFASRDSP